MQLKYKQLLTIFVLPVLFSTASVKAHHSLVGEFDTTVSFEVRGEITEVEWTNPHIWLYLDVTDEDGVTAKWECEMGSPNQLFRVGWQKQDLPPGTIIRARANPARDGSNTCSTRNITLDDGTAIFTRIGNR